MRQDTLLLSVTTLKPGRNDFHYKVPAACLDLPKNEFKLLEDVIVEFFVIKSGIKLFLLGAVQFTAEMDCAICGERFSKEFSARFKREYIKQPPKISTKTVLLSPDELDQIYFQGDTIDIGDLLHDEIILAIPLAPTCRTDCLGLCPECGANLNYEPTHHCPKR